MKARKRQIIKLSLMITLTFIFFLTEVICGHITGSLALISDSYHMISDVLALSIGLACVMVSTKSSTRNTFGWSRAEILGALFNAVFLATLCFTIFIEAVERLVHPHNIHEPDMLLVVGCIGLGINLFGIVMFCNEAHGHSHDVQLPATNGLHPPHSKTSSPSLIQSEQPSESLSNGMYTIVSTMSEEKDKVEPDKELKSGRGVTDDDFKSGQVDCDGENMNTICLELHEKQTKSTSTLHYGTIDVHDVNKKTIHSAGQMNIRGVFLHILGDALGSVVVITSALIVKYCEGNWTSRVDPVLSLVMISIILSTAFPLLKQTSLILLQHAPNDILPSELLDRLLAKIPEVLGVHELHVWQLVGSRNVASMHIKVKDSDSYEVAAERIRNLLHEEGVHSTTIQPEFVRMRDSPFDMECIMKCQVDDSCLGDRCCISVQKRKSNVV